VSVLKVNADVHSGTAGSSRLSECHRLPGTEAEDSHVLQKIDRCRGCAAWYRSVPFEDPFSLSMGNGEAG
jgi:hypothetical protein